MSQVIRVKFDPNGRADDRTYFYLCTYDVKVGDRVIVDSPFHGYTAVTVVETNHLFAKAKKHVVCTIDDREHKKRLAEQKTKERLADIEAALVRKRAEKRAEIEKRMVDQLLNNDPEVQKLKLEQAILAGTAAELVELGAPRMDFGYRLFPA